MQRLYVHIGAPKCASTSIQRFLFQNSAVLERHGFSIANENLEFGRRANNPLWFFQNLITSNPPDAARQVADRLRRLVGPMGLITAENLGNPHAAPLFSDAARHFDMRLLYVIRRQDDWILSAWKQWQSKIGRTLEDHVALAIQAGNPPYGRTLAAWTEVVPRENITVVSLDLLSPDTSIEQQTLRWLGIEEHAPEFEVQARRANESFDFRISDLLSRHRGICKDSHDERFEKLLARYSDLAGKHQFRIPDDMGERIMSAFRAENETLLGKEAAELLCARPAGRRLEANPGMHQSDHDFILACLLETMSNMAEEIGELRSDLDRLRKLKVPLPDTQSAASVVGRFLGLGRPR